MRGRRHLGRRGWAVIGAATLVCGCLAACSSSDKNSDGSTTVTIANVAPSPSKAITYAALEMGFFKRNHIKAKLVDFTGGGQAPVAAMASGSVDLAMIGLPDVLSATAKGALKGKFFYQYTGPLYDVVVRKGITNMAQLKGGRIAVSATASQDQVFMEAVLGKQGIKQGDVTFVTGGATLNRLALIQKSKVDAAAIAATQEPESMQYGTVLVKVNEVPNAFPTSFFFGTDRFLANKSVASNFTRAVSATAAWLRDPRNKAKYESICEKYAQATKQSCDEQLDYTMSHPDMWPTSGKVDTSGVQRGINLTAEIEPAVKDLKASDLIQQPVTATG